MILCQKVESSRLYRANTKVEYTNIVKHLQKITTKAEIIRENGSKSVADEEKENHISSLKGSIQAKDELIEGMIENYCETSEELDNLRTNHECVLMQLAAANERIKDLENKNKELNDK